MRASRVAVSAAGPDLDSPVHAAFGRCPYVVVIDLPQEGPAWSGIKVVENPSVEAASGAGIRSVHLLIGEGVTVLLTGRCGPKATDALAAAGIEVHPTAVGTVRDTIEAFVAQLRSGPVAGPDSAGRAGH